MDVKHLIEEARHGRGRKRLRLDASQPSQLGAGDAPAAAAATASGAVDVSAKVEHAQPAANGAVDGDSDEGHEKEDQMDLHVNGGIGDKCRASKRPRLKQEDEQKQTHIQVSIKDSCLA